MSAGHRPGGGFEVRVVIPLQSTGQTRPVSIACPAVRSRTSQTGGVGGPSAPHRRAAGSVVVGGAWRPKR